MTSYTCYIAAAYGIAGAVLLWVGVTSVLGWKKARKK
jgi:hypothetical protein